MTMPACCYPTPGAERAEELYCRYNSGGKPERAGLAFDGRPCPTWAQLLDRADRGDEGALGVVSKWRATALDNARPTETTINDMVMAYTNACHPVNVAAPGAEPRLWAFVAGWACREIGIPDLDRDLIGTFVSSWRRGWNACDAKWRGPQ